MINVKEENVRHAHKVKEVASRHLKVLIVDDDPLVVRFLVRASKKFDRQIQIDTASNGFDADEKIASDPPDIVILDVYLPGLRGDEICHRIKTNEASQHILVIVVTGYYDESLRRKLVKIGADVVMAKPLEAAKIINLLEEFSAKI